MKNSCNDVSEGGKILKRAVIYARYSCDKQTEQSIEGQVHVVTDFAKKNDYVIVDTYIDRAISGTTDNREAFQRMLRDSAKSKFEYVIVYKLDRFSRNRYDNAIHKSTLKKTGVKVISATEAISNTPEGIILEGLLESMAEYYSVELSQKVRRGLKESRNKGLYTGGIRLFGYDIIDQKYVINEEEAKVVRRLFKEYVTGRTIKEIVDDLNKEGIRTTKENKLNPSSISKMLHNRKYIGKAVIAGVEYPNLVPAIVDEKTFDFAQNNVKKILHRTYLKRSDETYILSGKLFCTCCGAPITGNAGTSKSKKVHHYYKCAKKTKKREYCPDSITFKKDELEESILNGIKEQIYDSAVVEQIIDNTVELYNNDIKDSVNINAIKNKLKEINYKIDNLTDAVANGLYNAVIQEKINTLVIDKSNLEKELIIQQALQEAPFTKDIVRKFLDKVINLASSDDDSKKMIFDIFLKRVDINEKGDMRIVCNTIEQESIKKEHSFEVFSTHQLGGAEGT